MFALYPMCGKIAATIDDYEHGFRRDRVGDGSAGILYVDDSGRYADFHSLRHSTGSLLAASGVHPKIIQSIMRHSDINLTMSRYTHIFRGQESEAVAKLPNLGLLSRGA